MVDAARLIEQIDAVPAVEYCRCGRPRSEHVYWEDRIYDYNGYRCPGSLGGDYRFDAQLTAANHKHARIELLAALLAGADRHETEQKEEISAPRATPEDAQRKTSTED